MVIWVDGAQSMDFASARFRPKGDRARVLAMAVLRGGERVGLTGQAVPPRRGDIQLMRIAAGLSGDAAPREDFGAPDVRGLLPKSRALFISDFMGPLVDVETALTDAADLGVHGVLLQVLE